MKNYRKLVAIGLSLCLIYSCSREPIEINEVAPYSVFKLVSPEESGLEFSNPIIETEENNHLVWESIYNGGGVGIGDLNNDGLMDIYLGGNMSQDRIYLNKGNLTFEDITQQTGIQEKDWSAGITIADVNNDGLADIYVCKMSWLKDHDSVESRTNKLYINKGDLTFIESAKKYGIADVGHSTQASFFDYDKDGLLDLYVMNAPSHRYDQKLDYMNKKSIPYEFKDHLYKNNGSSFEDVTLEAIGEHGHAYGLGLSTQDFNQDGWTDIYVANDFERPDLMLINDQNGKFVNKIQSKLKHISYSSMGMDAGDINNDGYPDIAVLDMQSNDHVRSKTNMPSMDIGQFWQNVANGFHYQFMSNMVQINNGNGFFSEIGQLTGMASTDWSWSILLQDFNNDRYNDAIITNGINRNIKDNDFNIMMEQNRASNNFSFLELAMKTKVEKVKNFAFENKNGNLTFEDVSEMWGFDHNGFSYGAAYADFDHDGDLDVIVNNNNEVAHLYENQSNNKRNHLRIQPTDNAMIAWNAKVYLVFDEDVQMSELHNVRGYQSCSEPFVHFGLGKKTTVPHVYVVFPDGKILHQQNVKANQTLTVDKRQAKSMAMPDFSKGKTFFTDLSKTSGIEYFHVENEYNDFDHQILIPHMESKNGPFASVADVNGDGLDDLFIGASKNDFGLIYLQNSNGKMVYVPNPSLLADQKYEDMGSCFFDVDNDGDLDLYVASGGSEHKENHTIYQDRLYINVGNGKFEKSQQILPSTNASKVIAIDVNQDGFKDLFVGGRMGGNNYPHAGHSHLLLNQKGKLTEDKSFDYQKMGMVTDAIPIDLNADSKDDLVVVGEWMQPTFFVNVDGKFVDFTDTFLKEKLVGWWFSVEKADLDGDGQMEILLGNIGMNNKYKASDKKPLKVYSGDFDQNDQYDIVLAKQTQYGEVPVRGFECSSQQLPMLKDKFESYNEFAHAQIPDLIDIEDTKTERFEANEFRSGYLKKEGESYRFVPFPPRAQISAVQGIVVCDVNYDQSPDVIIGGNHFDAEVETTRHDASVGLVLLNQKGILKEINPIESGLYLPGNVKDIQLFNMNGKKSMLVTNNNNRAQVIGIR